MLTPEENDLICRTDKGTPMGEVMRRYWQPFLISDELPDPDCDAIRVRLLGEQLVAFRDTNGVVGLVADACPHRGASMFFGINQECGLMCIYHGWKFDVNGECTDMPSDLPGSGFKDKVRIEAYPCIESAGVIWTYMGPKEKEPPHPNFIFNNLPQENVHAFRVPIYCNWLQSMEGNIDSTHLGTLHVDYQDMHPVDLEYDKPDTYPSGAFVRYNLAKYRYARIDVQDTSYGYRLIASRPTDNGNQHVRTNCHVLPYSTFIASPGKGGSVLIHPPTDDENCYRIGIQFRTDRPITGQERRTITMAGTYMESDGKTRKNREENDFNVDRWAQKNTILSGIWPFADQDYAIIETMGKIFDRTKEHLYQGDQAIIRNRQQLLKMAMDIQEGIDPPGTGNNNDIPHHLIHSVEKIIGPDDDPWFLEADAGETTEKGQRTR